MTITAVLTGVVLNYIKHKGYGWLEQPDHSSIFYHVSEVAERRVLTPGAIVSYEVVKDEKGRDRAVNIQPQNVEAA